MSRAELETPLDSQGVASPPNRPDCTDVRLAGTDG